MRLHYLVPIICLLVMQLCQQASADNDRKISSMSVYPQVYDAVDMKATPTGIWVACYGNGIWQFDGEKWISISLEKDERFVTSIAIGKQGFIFAGTWMGEHLLRIDPNTRAITRIPLPRNLPNWNRDYSRITRLTFDGNNIIASSLGGLAIFNGEQQWILTEKPDLVIWPLWANSEHGIWSATDNQLISFLKTGQLNQGFDITTPAGKMRITSISSVDSQLLLGTASGNAIFYDLTSNKYSILFEKPQGINAPLLAMISTKDVVYACYGSMSISTTTEENVGGIVVYDRNHNTSSIVNGLNNWKSLSLTTDSLWAAGKAGVMRIPLSNLSLLLDKPIVALQLDVETAK